MRRSVPATGFIRMAMRWRLCNAVLPAAALLAACVTTTKTFYLSPPSAPRITEDELRERANEVLYVECPRLLRNRSSASGEADLTLEVAREGAVSRVRLDESSGDARLDDIFGGLAATLRLEPKERANGEREAEGAGLSISYSCSPTAAAAVITRTRSGAPGLRNRQELPPARPG